MVFQKFGEAEPQPGIFRQAAVPFGEARRSTAGSLAP